MTIGAHAYRNLLARFYIQRPLFVGDQLAQFGGGLSPDGQWLVYAINRSNGDNELRITKLADGKTERRNVLRGAQSGDEVEILSGLEAGQVIIVP